MKIWRIYVDLLSWPVVLGTTLYGAWTHVALDGLMHADVPVWGSHSWANTEVPSELLIAMVIAGAGLSVVTYGLPWIVGVMERCVRGLLDRLT